jgi:selenium-binding protein 1
MPERRNFRGIPLEGGPARLQLSLDGRRLFVGNSFLRSWDEKIFPNLQKQGSIISLIHVNVNSAGSLSFDDNFYIDLGNERLDQPPLLSREMHFLNGDATSDAFL